MATSTASLVLDPAALQRRALELLVLVDGDPKRAAERMAAAEAHVRIVVAGGGRDRAAKLLDRAIDLDPYRADTYLLAAVWAHREGQLDAALERYEQAVSLDPMNVRLRLHCGFGFLDAARRPSLADDDAAELAEVAAEHFEAVLDLDPSHATAAFGAIEAAIYGKAAKLREALPRVLGRVEPAGEQLRTMTRLLYQAIFAFRVGKAKGVDQKNKKSMGEIADAARVWLAAFPSDPGLLGVIAATAAKCETAEELCEHVAEHARAIPDVRILRLLMRERLADVADPKRRLELFEGAMARIPALDGIAHDYLQMVHLVAKRAVAEGDLAAAEESWKRCEALDPDNPATTQNLLRLALHAGAKDRTAALERRLAEQWALYAELSPRADVVLGRASARARIDLDAELALLVKQRQNDGPRPPAALQIELVRRWIRAQALARLAAEPALLESRERASTAALLALDAEAAHQAALEVLAVPVQGKPPVTYSLLGLAKDAPDEVVIETRNEWREHHLRELAQVRQSGLPTATLERFIERVTEATRALTGRASRAAYDAGTCPTTQAEMYRLHARGFRLLVDLASALPEDEDTPSRERLVALLRSIPDVIRKPYLAVALHDEESLKVTLLRVQFGHVLLRGWQLLRDGEPAAVIDLCARALAGASELASSHRLYALALLADERLSPWEAAEKAREHAEAALRVVHWTDPPQATDDMRRLLNLPLTALAQDVAAQQALALASKDRSGDALRTLFVVYDGHRGWHPPQQTPAAQIFAPLPPRGAGFYAFVVARAMRESVIAWFNASRPQSHYDLANNRAFARSLTQAAGRWATLAGQSIASDPLHGDEAEQIRPAITKLLQQLQADLQALT